MNKILLTAISVANITLANVVYAEPRQLPPIIDYSSYSNGSTYSAQASSSQSMLEMLGRMEALQTEIQQLRGMIEEQGYEIDNLKQRQQNIYTDIDSRLQQLESGAGISSQTSGVSKYIAPVTSENTRAPTTVKQSQLKPIQPKPVETVKPASKADEKAAFDKAFMSVKNSHYQQSITLLEQFLHDYPNSTYSDNAYFWLASVYKVVNNIPAAKNNFQAVYTRFPKSEKAGMAMLKLADIYYEDNDTAKAEQLYRKVSQQYAGSTAAHMADKKLQNMGQ